MRRQSPSEALAPDRLQGRRSTRFARSASLVIDGLVAARAQNPALDAGGYKTVNNQGLPYYLRPGGSADAVGVPRSKAGTRGKYIYTFAAAHGAAVVVYGGVVGGEETPDQWLGDWNKKPSSGRVMVFFNCLRSYFFLDLCK